MRKGCGLCFALLGSFAVGPLCEAHRDFETASPPRFMRLEARCPEDHGEGRPVERASDLGVNLVTAASTSPGVAGVETALRWNVSGVTY